MDREPMVVTTVRVPRRVWIALRALAEARALEHGGRASVSAVVADLAEEKAREADRGRAQRG
jgi:hypothetical protein